MTHPLDGTRLKIVRAEEHLDTLDGENRAYMDDQPYEIVHERDEERSSDVYRFHVRQPPPLRLSILMGDCLHNLRSGLNHLAWQLVFADSGTPTTQTDFPIFKAESDFRAHKKRKKAPTGVAGGVSQQAAALIERLQPYNKTDGSPEEHPLWILHYRNNVDKHRRLSLTTLGTSNTQITLTNTAGHPISALQFLDHPRGAGPVDDGTEVGAFPILDNPEMKINMQGTAFVALNEATVPNHRPIGYIVEESLEFVRDVVVPGFEPFFNQSS